MPYGIGGVLPDWNIDNSANRFVQSYVKDFIDISGSLVLRNNANLYVNGNITVNGKLLLNNTNLQTDLSFNKRIFVGSDMSMNGNVTIKNDVSLNGSVLGCTFNVNSIPTNAFSGTVTASSPDYTKASVIYPQKFRANADVSLNGSTVQATNMTVNGNIVFNDGTKMSTYDNNILSGSYAQGDVIFKASTFTGLTIINTLTAGSYVVSSDYRIKKDVVKLDNRFTVDNLRPVKYLQTLTNKEQYGFIAHELQQYYPDLVIGEKDGPELQRVNYTGLIAILINEIIQLRLDFAELEKKRQPAI